MTWKKVAVLSYHRFVIKSQKWKQTMNHLIYKDNKNYDALSTLYGVFKCRNTESLANRRKLLRLSQRIFLLFCNSFFLWRRLRPILVWFYLFVRLFLIFSYMMIDVGGWYSVYNSMVIFRRELVTMGCQYHFSRVVLLCLKLNMCIEVSIIFEINKLKAIKVWMIFLYISTVFFIQSSK